MNIVTVDKVNFSGRGNAPTARYAENDVVQLSKQSGIAGVAQVNVIYFGDSFEVTALIGLDSGQNQQKDAHHLVILPCPPYCSKKGDGPNKIKNSDDMRSEGWLYFADAIEIFDKYKP